MCSGSVAMALYKLQVHPRMIILVALLWPGTQPYQSRDAQIKRRLWPHAESIINHWHNVWNTWTFEHRKGHSKPRKNTRSRHDQSRHPENEVYPHSSHSTEERVRIVTSQSQFAVGPCLAHECTMNHFQGGQASQCICLQKNKSVDKAIRRSQRHPHQRPQPLPLTVAVAVAAGDKGAAARAATHQEAGTRPPPPLLHLRALLHRR